MRNEKKALVVWGFIGGFFLPSHVGIIIDHYI